VIAVIYGTTGELIKLAPVLVRLRDRGEPFLNVTTGQQVQQIPALLDSLELPQPDLWLARGANGRDLGTSRDIPGWFAGVLRTFLQGRRRLRASLTAGATRPLVLVHGDTMTTVLGAAMGRALHVPVAHIEGGLRSYDLRHPFPEELNRRITSRLASIHYAPGAWAAGNLSRGSIVDTGSNTVRDSLELCADGKPAGIVPEGEFGIVSLHRFELLNDRDLLESTLRTLAERANGRRLLFVDHPVTVAAIRRYGLDAFFDDGVLTRIPRLGFREFVPLMRLASFLVTDSGGSQEETYYLDLPCLVHRKRTERQEGIGETAILSGHDPRVLGDFLDDPSRFRRRTTLPISSPSDVIVEDLAARGFI
jgi:UDP-N-acetylglucosamine 2-epimerase (non-hydrolysing)